MWIFRRLVNVRRFLGAVCCFFIGGAVLLQAAEKIKVLPTIDNVFIVTVGPEDLVIGERTAPVTLVSYTSATCYHCAAFHNETIPDLYDDYIKTGKLKIVMRHFPLDKLSLYAATFIEQAPANQRLGRLEVLFKTQAQWVDAENSLAEMARICGMKLEDFQKCVTKEENQASVLKQVLIAKDQFHVKATPSFIIQGRLYEGKLELPELKQLIEQAY